MADTPRIPNPYARHRSASAAHRGESRSGRSLPYAQQPFPLRWPTRLDHHGEGSDPSGQELARSIRSASVSALQICYGIERGLVPNVPDNGQPIPNPVMEGLPTILKMMA